MRAACLVVLCLWIVLLAAVCPKLFGLAPDDMYITYRYAGNLLAGKGLTFNPGERVFGVSDPGVALLLAAAGALTGLSIPVAGTLLTATALLVIAGVVLWEARKRERLYEAAASGALILTSSFLWLGQGSGPLVALAFLLLAALLAERHPAAAGVLGGAAVWCRPDVLIGCGILGWMILRRERRLPIAFAAGAAAVCGIGLGLAWWYFGRLVPSTLTAKQAFAARILASVTGLQGFWGRALDIFRSSEGGWALALIPLGIFGLVSLFRRTGLAGRLLVAYGSALALGYTLLRVPFSIWYVGPTAALILIGSAFAVGEGVRFAARRAGKAAAAGLLLTVLLAVGLPTARTRRDRLWEGSSGDWRRAAYRAAGEWLAKNTPPDADVAFDEIGIVGFYSRRPMLDLIGLVSPTSIPYAAAGDPLGAFLAKPTRYVLLHTHDRRGGTRPIVSRPWFPRCYRERARIPVPRFGMSMVVYERRPQGRLPPPRPPRDKRLAEGPGTHSAAPAASASAASARPAAKLAGR